MIFPRSIRDIAVMFVDVISLSVGKAIDAGCELFDLDGEDHE